MRSALNRLKPDLLVALLLLVLPLVHFAPVALGTRTLLPADNLFAIEPWASAASQFGYETPPVPHNKLLDDLVLENYPWKKFILESLRSGELPLWNPYQFAGLPFMAAGQHSTLYPFSVIFYLAPLPRAYGLFTVSQFFLAGLFAYAYLRVLGLRRAAALLGGIAYELSLFMVVSVVFPMIVAGAAWLPLILAAVELTVRQQPALGGRPATTPWLILGAGALGLQILAGHVEITYYTLLVTGAYAAWRLLVELAQARTRAPAGNGHKPPRLAGVRWSFNRSGALLALAGLGLALGAIQFVPLYELVQHNFRSGSASFQQILDWAYPARHVLHFLIPNVFGNPSHHGYFDLFAWQWTPATVNAHGDRIDTIFWGEKNYVEGGAYLGLLTMLLATVGVAQWASRRWAAWRVHRVIQASAGPSEQGGQPSLVPFYAALAALSLAFAFGTPLYALIFWLPGIDQLHSPFRWVWPLTFSAAVLAAYGLHGLLCSAGQGRQVLRIDTRQGPTFDRHRLSGWRLLTLGAEPSLTAGLAGAAVWGGTAVLAGLLVAWLGYESLGVGRLMDFWLVDLARADQAFANGRMFFAYEAPWVALFGALAIASGLVLRLSQSNRQWRGRPAWVYLAPAVLALDLFAAGWGFNPAADPAILTYTPPSVEFLRQHDPGLWRFTSFDPDGQKPFNANVGWYFNFYDVRGYDSIFTRQYRDYMQLIQHQYELDFNRIAPISEATALDSPLLDLLNVKYVVTLKEIDNPKYSLVYSGEVLIYRNETALPRAFTLPASATLITEDFAAAVQSYDPRRYVITADAGDWAEPDMATPQWPGPVETAVYTPNEVILDATVAEPSWLVLADSYFPGWKAYLREAGKGDETEQALDIHLVNGNFRGVQLPAGDWTVRFKYSPDSIKIGGIVSFLAGMTLVFMLGLYAWRYFYRESAVNSTARRVAKNSLAPMALNLTNRAVDLIFAAFYLRVLGPGDAGAYYFAIVIYGWFEIVTNYGLNALLTRDVSRDREHANRYLVNTTILRLLIGLAAIPVLALILAGYQLVPSFVLPFGLGEFHPDRLSSGTLWAIGLLVLAQAPNTIATGLSALFYAFEKAEYPAAVSTITTLAKVGLGTIALVLGFGYVGLAGVSVIVNSLTLGVLGWLAWRLFFRPRLEVDWGLQRHALRESFPLMLNNLLATLFFKVDVTLIKPIRGEIEVGWYSTGYKYIDAYNVIPALFTFALFPVISRQADEDRPALQRSYTLAVKLLVAVALPLAVVTTALAPVMVGLLGGADFLPQGATALAILAWSMPFGWINSVTNYVLIALGQQRGLTRAFAAALAFNVVLNLLFLPRYGFAAAAAITIASEFFEGLAFYRYLRRSLGPVPWVAILWRLWLSAGVMAALTYGLWSFEPLLALAGGLAAYWLGLWGLRAFTPEEQAVLFDVMPLRLRRRPEIA